MLFLIFQGYWTDTGWFAQLNWAEIDCLEGVRDMFFGDVGVDVCGVGLGVAKEISDCFGTIAAHGQEGTGRVAEGVEVEVSVSGVFQAGLDLMRDGVRVRPSPEYSLSMFQIHGGQDGLAS